MEITVLGYKGELAKGSYGFYVDFNVDSQDHFSIVGLIAQQYGLLINNANIWSDIDWRPIFSKFSYMNFGKKHIRGCRFPEFETENGLLKFISLLNNGLTKSDPNFINIENFV